MNYLSKLGLGIIFVFLISQEINAQSNMLNSIDTLSKAYKKKIKKKNKILPVALPVTEPAVGVGLVGGLIYFIQKKDSLGKADMIGGAAGITTNGT